MKAQNVYETFSSKRI